MRKRGLVVLMLACLAVTGCRKAIDVDSIEHNNDTASTDYDDTYVEPEEDYIEEEEYEGEEEEIPDSPAEVEGIVGMLYNAGTFQIITINPESGEQSVFANFYLGGDSPDFIGPSKRVAMLTGSFYGNRRDWFSDDYTKMIYTQYDISDDGALIKSHAGWIDRNGEFFDVTAAVGMEHGTDFSNPSPESQSACGFREEMFIFNEGDTYYQVPTNNVSSDQVSEINGDDWHYKRKLYNLDQPSNGLQYPYTTSWIDDNRCIADSYLCDYVVNSVIVQTETDEEIEYIPKAERNNWSGVISPDGSTIAFFSISSKYDGTSPEIYTIPLAGGEPSKLSVNQAGSDLLFDLTNVSHKDIGMGISETGKSESEKFRCYLLGWE